MKVLALLTIFLFMQSIGFSAAMGNGGPMGASTMGGPEVPINNGLIFLVLVGMVYGLKMLYDLSKQKKAVSK